jgi:hypothetical protein
MLVFLHWQIIPSTSPRCKRIYYDRSRNVFSWNHIFPTTLDGSKGTGPRCDKWKQAHKGEIQIYKSQITERHISHSVQAFGIWRIIMKSKVSKIAVAALIIIAVLINMHKLSGSIDGASVAWGNVAEKVKNIETYVYREREIKTTGPREEGFEVATERETIVYRSDRYGERTESYTKGELLTNSWNRSARVNLCGNIYLPGLNSFPEEYRYGRRLPSFQGPDQRRRRLVPFHIKDPQRRRRLRSD